MGATKPRGQLAVKAIVFDMDGTLYHQPALERRYRESIIQTIATVKKVPFVQARSLFEELYQQTRRRLKREPSKLSLLQSMGISHRLWAKTAGRQVAPERWLKTDRKLKTVLGRLQQEFKLAVVTNNHDHNTKVTLKRLEILDFFDAVQTLSATELLKPSARRYRMICKTLGVHPREALSVGDRFDLDLAPAASIGMSTLLVTGMQDIYHLPEVITSIPATPLSLVREMPGKIFTKAMRALVKEHLVILPTDTVYGIAAYPSPAAIAALYRAKGREEHNPLVLLISDAQQAERFAVLSVKTKALMDAYWPGALTLVLPVRPGTPWGRLTRGGRWIGLRCPAHPETRQLIKRCGGVLATSSANRSGQAAATSFAALDRKLLAFVDYAIDGGPSQMGVSSTIVKVSGQKVMILRQGALVISRKS